MRDARAFGEESLGAGEADALAAAGDEDVLLAEAEIHLRSVVAKFGVEAVILSP